MASSPSPTNRKRIIYSFLILFVVACGLASRSSLATFFPGFFSSYAGDTLWALMVYLLIGWLLPRMAPGKVALAALAFAFSIELSQLYQDDWINHIRANPLAALVLGSGFLWSDLACYTAGILIGFFGERWLLCRSPT